MRSRIVSMFIALACAGLVAACGSVANPEGEADAAVAPPDANSLRPPDAGPDAMTAQVAVAPELTGGSGVMTGGGFTMQIQVGHARWQAPAVGASTLLTGGGPIAED